MLDVRFKEGVELPAHGLWLDPHRARPLAFVSHAHSDHLARHSEVLLTPATARLMRARMGGKRVEHLLPYGVPAAFGEARATLLSAGHICGSAQLFLESDAGTLLYTGDFKFRGSRSVDPCQWRRAETLVMETTFGLPKYHFPPTEEVVQAVIEFCRENLARGIVPVLYAYSLGKAQEIVWALLEQGLVPMLAPPAYRMTEICAEMQPRFPKGYLQLELSKAAGHVLVVPPGRKTKQLLASVQPQRTAVLTGWALNPYARFRYGTDAAFALSDHADYPDLLRYVELVQPKRVLTLHGYAAIFATDLRARGVEAWALSEENQLELGL
ncbi:MAG: DNA ligase-1 [Verrucomicrobia bacterium]|nr:MAG: DNA ligase-1 [Verrucomicrobiota bacterium]